MAAAEEPLLEGDCGAKVRWTLNTDTGELVIKGTGAMTNYSPLVHPSWSSKSGIITSVTVEDGVTSLGSYAFLYCSNLVTVTLPDTVKTLPASLFSGCRSLTAVRMPAGLTSVGDSAFNGCQSLTEVVLPEGVTAVGNKAFNGCTGPLTVITPNTQQEVGATFSKVGNAGVEYQFASSGSGSGSTPSTPEATTSGLIADGTIRWTYIPVAGMLFVEPAVAGTAVAMYTASTRQMPAFRLRSVLSYKYSPLG